MFRFFLSVMCLGMSLYGDVEDLVIIGGGPAGLTAAIFAGQAGLAPLVVKGSEGQSAAIQNIENFPGFPQGISGIEIEQRVNEQALRFGTRFSSNCVAQIELEHSPVTITLSGGTKIYARVVILATGSTPRRLGIPNEESWKEKGVHVNALQARDRYVNQDVIVVGGGDAAVEQALILSETANTVLLISRGSDLKAAQYLKERVHAQSNVRLLFNHEVVDLIGHPLEAALIDAEEGSKIFPCSAVFVAQGRIPNTALFKGQLPMTSQGYIQVDKIPYPHVFIAGDIASNAPRKMVTSAASGAQAALQAIEYLKKGT